MRLVRDGYTITVNISRRKRLALWLIGKVARFGGLQVAVDFRLSWQPPPLDAVAKEARG